MKTSMKTIGQMVKQFGLSRSTLLYYDKIGLLQPSGRSEANYRLYTKADIQRMEQIMLYKEAGLSLKVITCLLADAQNHSSTAILEQRLAQLNTEISQLRQQQQVVVGLLGESSLLRTTKVLDKAQWVAILRASGMDEAAMRQWHIEFERSMPQAHQDFLECLGIDDAEIAKIRAFE